MYSRKAGRWSAAVPSCSPMTTVLPPAVPVVIVVCACAAIGAAIAPAIAAMANSLFRMVNSFARRCAGFRQHTHAGPIHRVRHCSGKNAASYAAFLGNCCGGWNPLKWWRSEEHTSELQSRQYLVCRLLLEKKKKTTHSTERLLQR